MNVRRFSCSTMTTTSISVHHVQCSHLYAWLGARQPLLLIFSRQTTGLWVRLQTCRKRPAPSTHTWARDRRFPRSLVTTAQLEAPHQTRVPDQAMALSLQLSASASPSSQAGLQRFSVVVHDQGGQKER